MPETNTFLIIMLHQKDLNITEKSLVTRRRHAVGYYQFCGTVINVIKKTKISTKLIISDCIHVPYDIFRQLMGFY